MGQTGTSINDVVMQINDLIGMLRGQVIKQAQEIDALKKELEDIKKPKE